MRPKRVRNHSERCMIRLKRIYNFWCSILVLHQLLCVLFTLRGIFMHFLELTYYRDAIVPVPCFLLFLYFRKVTQEIFSKLDETKAKVSIYLTRRRSPEERRRQTKGKPHHRVARATPWPRHQVVWPLGPPPDIALLPINCLRRENPKETKTSPQNILQAAIVVVPRSGGSRSSSQHPAKEGNHHRRPSTSPCLPPEWCVSSLPWTMGP
jgi:hypothetical protein